MSKTIVICATVAFVALVGAFVVLTYAGKDTASLVTFAMGIAAAVVPAMAGYLKSSQTQKTVEHVAESVEVVKDQTNGPMTAAIKQMTNVAEEIREMNGHTKS